MSQEQFDKLEREWLDSGDWKTTSLDLEFKVWLEMKGYKLSQEEFDKFNIKNKRNLINSILKRDDKVI
mgnify:CR=1 FL=1